jgi:hypothetical protein
MSHTSNACGCGRVSRRSFLADTGMGFTGLALGALLFRDGVARAADNFGPQSGPHLPQRANSVIWIFLCGGVSHLESFDIKPELNKYGGQSIDDTPYKHFLDDKRINQNLVGINPTHVQRKQLMALQTGYKKYGECGLEVGDWFRHIGECADDLAVVRSLWTCHNDHGTQLTWHTGRHPREGSFPTIGSWATYGLGTMNDNLPDYVVLGVPTGDCCGGEWTHGAGYLGPQYAGVRLNVGAANPLPFVTPPSGQILPQEQAAEFSLLGKLNALSGIEYPDDKVLRARIKSYELAFGMQSAVPEVLDFKSETTETQNLYGMDQKTTQPFGQLCLSARRLVERGVRFVQVYSGGAHNDDNWDAHGDLEANHNKHALATDQPIAALVKDLKQRGLFDETLIVWGGEFGRQPTAEYAEGTGRDHNAYGFTMWMAGGGIKGGISVGTTDEIGSAAVDQPMHVKRMHATVLQQMGLDPNRLSYFFRGLDQKLVGVEHVEPIEEIIA